ncbi:MAG: hypothetical protein BRD48_02300 [Bacteroidetes bacterium QS_9_68_14]|nr:MAG: hypothetical protein BRD48_02300 [Bacteroidetes bacterium QS_9_68_14]
MPSDKPLRRKYTFKTAGEDDKTAQVVLVKHKREREAHVWMKAFLWALYLPAYPDLQVEVPAPREDRYKPDVVALDPWDDPRLWGEAGAVSAAKIRALLQRYPRTHFALGKWDQPLGRVAATVREVLRDRPTRHAPLDLLRFDADSRERFIDENGRVTLSFEEIEWRRL